MRKISYSLVMLFTLYYPLITPTLKAETSSSPTHVTTTPFQTGQIVAQNQILYRKIITVTPEGYYQVQNFYLQTHNKQSDPFIIKEAKNLSTFQVLETYNLQNLNFNGPLTLWFENGNKSTEFFIIDGKAEGYFNNYYINGKKQIAGNHKAGKPSGLWQYWNIEGELEKKVYYHQGIIQWQKDNFILKGF